MKRKRGWLFYPLIIVALLLCAFPAHAGTPTLPHAFYGTLTIDGSPAAVGTVVKAKVGGVECGSITTTVAGQYGGSGAFEQKLAVSGEIDTGATIYFYANNVEADQTYAFSSGAVTELNLTVETPADTTAPTVVSTVPANGASNVAVDTTVTVTFSEAMKASTITTGSFTLVADSTSVSGSVSYNSGTYTATFTPSADLSEDTTCTATLSTAITDAAGNPLASAYSWSFDTIGAVVPGDATGDGVVDARDITKVERIIAGLDAATPGADATEDGLIDARDITKVEMIIAGLG
jgi:hypothetical protein